ncbi:hypothetical protein [Oxobacter pfennigii]|uniref:hypothetical protein n=1 Tax=Oxobacter pfennigii TaxID=36849 RepID=UPI0013648D7B|nr:hypothetical protein [Oxobacter pfennigii]
MAVKLLTYHANHTVLLSMSHRIKVVRGIPSIFILKGLDFMFTVGVDIAKNNH